MGRLISDKFKEHREAQLKRIVSIKNSSEQLNKIYLDVYGLSEEMPYEVSENSTGIALDSERDAVISLLSYAVGCMFGRYSLDEEGLVFAGGAFDLNRYRTYKPDKDNIIPIVDDEYFQDDVVALLIDFLIKVYGEDTIEDNLKYIAKVLGGKGSSREIIRNYFINDFYTDHCNAYSVTGSGRRPIYWLFDSGKNNAFKCLIYIHRYQPDTVARIRTDYVHELQARFRTAISDLEHRIAGASTSERVSLTKKLTKIKAQSDELREYEEKIHHLADQMISIDLDDGVKHNYEIFKDVLAKIK